MAGIGDKAARVFSARLEHSLAPWCVMRALPIC